MGKSMVIAIDALGGDNAPNAVVEGCLLALKAYPEIEVRLTGPKERIEAMLPDTAEVKSRIAVVDAPEEITMHDPPVMAIRKKTNSSLVRCCEMLRAKDVDAMVSAGSTGAVLAGGMFKVGRIRGIERPALSPVIPAAQNPYLLIDCGANVDCKPEYLAQFGEMGSIYMRSVMGVSNPRVALANIGAEAEKGNALIKDAYQLLSKQSYNFTGNIEARDIPAGACDVVVCDGFVGNMILKLTEGMAGTLMGMLKEQMMASTLSKLGALLLKPGLRAFKKRMDYTEYGGAPLLGIDGVVIKAHGSSNARAISSAIGQAVKMVKGGVVEKIHANIKAETAQ